MSTVKNSVYNTLKGNYSAWTSDHKSWEYTFLYGTCRFCKNYGYKLSIPNVNYSFHINTYGKNTTHSFAKNFHFAFIKKFPFVLIGFDQVKKYIIYE